MPEESNEDSLEVRRETIMRIATSLMDLKPSERRSVIRRAGGCTCSCDDDEDHEENGGG